MSLSCCERLNDGLLIFIGDIFVMQVKATSLFRKDISDSLTPTPQCAGIHRSVTSTRAFRREKILVRLFSSLFFGRGDEERIKY